METHRPLPLHLFVLLLVLLSFHSTGAQSITNSTVIARFACNVSAPCHTFAVYRTQSPGFLDFGSISDIFGVSRLLVASANNLISEDGALLSGQLLIVPIQCGCTGRQSYANVTYPVRTGDTFYALALTAFENLTDYGLIEKLNPKADPNNLMPGQEVIIPLFCRCPSEADLRRGMRHLITYMWQVGDEMSAVSKLMSSSVGDIAAANNVSINFSSTVAQPMVIPVPQPPQLPPLRYNNGDSMSWPRSRLSHRIIIACSVTGSLVACASLCVSVLACRRYHKKALVHSGSSQESAQLAWTKNPFGLEGSSSGAHMRGGGGKLLSGVSQFIDKPVIFEVDEIMEATMNLDERCKIGGSFYRAKLDGEVYAVRPAKGDVSAELGIMQVVNHGNLIKLAGISIGSDGDYAFLVYEFAEKGSLDKWLYQKPLSMLLPSSSSTTTLPWERRLSIVLDIANGLLYMHEHTQPSIVHGDVRARNILLTADFKAKISNFSVAKPAMVDAVATSSDVFAYGLLLLELLSGRRAMEARVGSEIGMLWKEIRVVLERDKREAKLKKWMDPALGGQYNMDEAVSLASMARACTDEDSARRPRMAEVVFSLAVLMQSSPAADAFEKLWLPSSEENIGITNAVSAR